MRVTYLAHDLDDPSVWRRVEMLRRGGATVGCTGVGVVMGCRVLDERVVVADCASTVPAAASRPHSTRPRAEEEIVMSGTTLHER